MTILTYHDLQANRTYIFSHTDQEKFVSLEHSANIEDLSSVKINSIAYVSLEETKDIQGNPLHILWVSNGTLRISLIMERGFDVGEVFCREEKISWVRDKERCLSDISVDLNQENGWEKGFFAAVTTLGPQLFGTPDEIRTVHGTGAYSPFDLESLVIIYDKKEISVSAEGFSKGFRGEVEYKKKVTMRTRMNSLVFLREEITINLTDRTLPIDDGYHIQLAGDFMAEGGSYVLPVATDQMLLRDSVPKEVSPKEIYDFNTELDPIRCYQYVPERVTGVEGIGDFKEYKQIQENKDNLTCEMLVNKKGNKAVVVVRPLDVFPRSLLAKRNIAGDDAMYAIEVCKTRPNSIRQKAIDGELMYLEAHASMQSMVAIGILEEELIREMVTCIETRRSRE